MILGYHLPDANSPSLIEKLELNNPYSAASLISKYDFQSITNDFDGVRVESFLRKPFDLVDFEIALSAAFSKVSEPGRKDVRQADRKSASTLTQGTHRKRS